MAKKAASKKPTKKASKKKPEIHIVAAPDAIKAASIVAHVLSHFGGGYCAQRQVENPAAGPVNAQIYRNPSDLSGFHFLLYESTLRNLGKLNWDTNQPVRDKVSQAAFAHGVAARKQVVADGTPTLSLTQILMTLRAIQASICPGAGGAGGGDVCDF